MDPVMFSISAVDECRKQLLEAGFKELRETEHWTIQPNDKVLVNRC